MSNILPILAIVAAAIGATTFFSKSPSSLPSPAPAPVPYGGSKRKTNKRNKNRTNKRNKNRANK
jgi:hypothetical protein